MFYSESHDQILDINSRARQCASARKLSWQLTTFSLDLNYFFMNILCIEGDPSGLYFALLMKLRQPAARVTVVERNRPFDTFGWGIVLSGQTLANLRRADPKCAQLVGDAFNHWDDIEVLFKGRSVRSGGHGFCGGRKRLLNILQDRCIELGVDLVFGPAICR